MTVFYLSFLPFVEQPIQTTERFDYLERNLGSPGNDRNRDSLAPRRNRTASMKHITRPLFTPHSKNPYVHKATFKPRTQIWCLHSAVTSEKNQSSTDKLHAYPVSVRYLGVVPEGHDRLWWQWGTSMHWGRSRFSGSIDLLAAIPVLSESLSGQTTLRRQEWQ